MPGTRTSSGLELHLPLRRDDSQPLHRQLERELRTAIRVGRLAAATAVPSSRALARQLGVSRGVVVDAYEQLTAEGYLSSRPGGATTVSRAATAPATRRQAPRAERFLVDFRPGRPDLDAFPRSVWLRSLRRVLAESPSERFGYLDGRGVPELRAALSAYLDRVRGTVSDPQRILICSGFGQGIGLLAKVLMARGTRRVALEDPCLDDTRATLDGAGLDVVNIPVDESGIRVELLDAAAADAVIVTPAHHYPTGGVLPATRRAALIEWAARRGGLIVEDDYDAEFRYDREPIGAMQGLCPERIVYAGTASKILAPGLRLGWLVLPPALFDGMVSAKRNADLGSPALDQLAFADFIERGELDRHLRRMRPIYRRRRDALLAAIDRHLPSLHPVGASAGLHVLAWLPPELDEAAFVRAAATAGVGLAGVTPSRGASGPGGVIFGYGAVDEAAVEPGIRRIASAVA